MQKGLGGRLRPVVGLLLGLRGVVVRHRQVEQPSGVFDQVVELLGRKAGGVQQHAQLALIRLVRALDATPWARVVRGELGDGHALCFGELLGAGGEHIRAQVELQTLSAAERRGEAVGSAQGHLLGQGRLRLVLEGVGRDGSARAEVCDHVDVRVPLSGGPDRPHVVEVEHLARVGGLAVVVVRERRHPRGDGVDLQARGARELRRRELDVDRRALHHLVLHHLLQLGIARVAVQFVREAIRVELVMHVPM